MNKRRRKQSVREITTSQVEEVLGKYADAHYRHKEITAQMEQEITAIREKYAPKLEEHSSVMDDRFSELQLYAETHADDFEKKRGRKFSHGIIGFRTGTPKAKTLRGYTWAAVLKLMKEFLPDYIVSKEAPAKERLIADREKLQQQELLEKVGVEVVQEETFFVEVNEEESVTV